MDQLIHEGGLRIVDVEPLAHQGLIVVMLNSGTPLMVHTALFPRLVQAKPDQLSRWEIIAGGTAIAWDELDEHLSLKGFLNAEVRNEVMDRLQVHLALSKARRKAKPAAHRSPRTAVKNRKTAKSR